MIGTVEQRFWSKVDTSAGLFACWPWVATRNGRGGYGQMGLNGRIAYAHRISWQLANGPIPSGLDVLHSCDNPPCVNPAHLWTGTASDNGRDMVAKGRHKAVTHPEREARGEATGHAKLTTEIVIAVRARGRLDMADRLRLAAAYGVHPETLRRAHARLTWTHLP